MNERDKARLGDMLDESRRVQRFIMGKTRSDFDTDDLLAYGVVRALEIIGEAARLVSDETQKLYPQIEWTAIIGMRHRLAHHYLNVDYDIVWLVVRDKIPELTEQLRAILGEN